MASFAQVHDGIVVQVLKVDNPVIETSEGESEALGQEFLAGLLGGEWVQTWFTEGAAPANHPRGKYAAKGDLWDGSNFSTPPLPGEVPAP